MTSKRSFCITVCLVFSIFITGCLPQILPEIDIENQTTPIDAQVTATFTVQPTRIAIPTLTPMPSGQGGNKPFPTATPRGQNQMSVLQVKLTPASEDVVADNAPCYQAAFIRNVTVADGAGFQPGDSLLKTWEIQNTGSCEWTEATVLALAHGFAMEAPPNIALNTRVPPGAIIDLSLQLTTPNEPGTYQGFWKLQNRMGVPIEMSNAPDSEMAVKIIVFTPNTPEPGLTFDFTSNFCAAEWTSSKGLITCPSKELAGEQGAVIRSFTPMLENNTKDNEPALVVLPSEGAHGFIGAIYPKYTVKEGDHFKAVIGCMQKMPKCWVSFELNYTADGKTVQNLFSYSEVYDGKLRSLDFNLADLKGKTVQFILTVTNAGDSLDDQVFWLWPRISNPNATD